MTYAGWIRRLDRRGQFRITPGLERITCVLGFLGDPHRLFRAVHIAGTNGKGSVAASIESVARAAGIRTGLYTSPHLTDVRERIRIGFRWISRPDFVRFAERVHTAERKAGVRLTYFEFLTALAFLFFADRRIQLAVIETGLGGRWDATNVLIHPELCVLTSIGRDHTRWLGRTEAQIASEKAGILKPGVPVVSGVRGPGRAVIEKAARRLMVPMQQIDRDFQAGSSHVNWSKGFQTLRYKTGRRRRSVRYGLLGTHQIDNAAVALAGIDVLVRSGWRIPAEAIRRGMSSVRWPGRFQLQRCRNGLPCILDGAHNAHAITRLMESLALSPWRNRPLTFVVGIYRDKDYEAMADLIARRTSQVYVCTLPGRRGLPAATLERVFAQRLSKDCVHRCAAPEDAWTRALRDTDPHHALIATGSLTLIGSLILHRKDLSWPKN